LKYTIQRERANSDYNLNNSSNEPRKKVCSRCGEYDFLTLGVCYKCALINARLEIQELIKEQGLKSVQIQWENIIKPGFERNLRNIEQPQNQTGLTEQQKQEIKKGEQRLREYIQTIEADLYPERKSNQGGSGWIWFLVIAIVMVGGLVGFLIWRKKKKH